MDAAPHTSERWEQQWLFDPGPRAPAPVRRRRQSRAKDAEIAELRAKAEALAARVRDIEDEHAAEIRHLEQRYASTGRTPLTASPQSRTERDLAKALDKIGRYRRLLERNRKRSEHHVARLARKLAWLGFEDEDAFRAMRDGLLVGPGATVQLTAREQAMFRELWTEVESELSRHYDLKWQRAGMTEAALERGRALGLEGADLTEYGISERDDWVNEQMHLDPWPWPDGDD